MTDKSKIIHCSLSSARSCLSRANYGRAFANFLLFLKLAPDRSNEIHEEFDFVFREWSAELGRNSRISDLFKCYDQACEMYPNHESVLNTIGAQLFGLGYPEEAAAYIRRAMLVRPGYLAARENLENINCHLVERWHFRMLNDTVRNGKYKNAIKNAVKRGYREVLDIGAGSGILSLTAADTGARVVYACERSKVMYDVAQTVLNGNSLDKKIKLILKCSTELIIPEDLPSRVSLIVTETFDAGLFGEGIISTLLHAWRHLLFTEEGKGIVIPGSATVYVCGIECQAIREQQRLLYSGFPDVDSSEGHFQCTTGSDRDDPYTTENLGRVRGGYKPLTNVSQLIHINFCDTKELEKINQGIEWTVPLDVTQSGRLDALALWFDLHLDDTITLATVPTNQNCWEQAIYPVQRLDNIESLNVQQRAVLTAVFSFCEDCLRLRSCRIDTKNKQPELQSQSTGACSVINQDFLAMNITGETDLSANCIEEKNKFGKRLIFLESSDMRSLNDLQLNRTYFSLLKTTKEKHPFKTLSFVFVSSQLSFVGIQARKMAFFPVTMVIPEHVHKSFQQMALLNGFNKIDFPLVDSCKGLPSGVTGDVVLFDMVEPSGVLRQQALEDLACAWIIGLSKGCTVLPGEITVHGIFIESEELLNYSRVTGNDKTLGYHIAKYINVYQMRTHLDIDLTTLPHTKLSEPFQLLHLNYKQLSDTDFDARAFLNFCLEKRVNVIDSGSVSALVYWFELGLTDDLRLSTLDSQSHWRQAAIIYDGTKTVASGQVLHVNVALQNSCMDVTFLQEDLGDDD